MLAIEDAKLPPPTPASAASTSSVSKETPGSSKTAAAIVGTSSRHALMTVQLRPPNFATAKCRAAGRRAERRRHRRQQELLRCRGLQVMADPVGRRQEQHEYRPQAPDRETRCARRRPRTPGCGARDLEPTRSQKPASSGRQSSIHLPERGGTRRPVRNWLIGRYRRHSVSSPSPRLDENSMATLERSRCHAVHAGQRRRNIFRTQRMTVR